MEQTFYFIRFLCKIKILNISVPMFTGSGLRVNIAESKNLLKPKKWVYNKDDDY